MRAVCNQGGFTLIEVVVALVALSLAVAVVYESMGQGLRRSAADRQRAAAWLIAKSLLAEIRQAPGLQIGVREGVAPPGLQWRYEILAERTSTVRDIAAFEVAITVKWGTRPAQRVELRSIEIPGMVL
jgi:prepilin-type N-terminal cleavage/methylation domain-containing protein